MYKQGLFRDPGAAGDLKLDVESTRGCLRLFERTESNEEEQKKNRRCVARVVRCNYWSETLG